MLNDLLIKWYSYRLNHYKDKLKRVEEYLGAGGWKTHKLCVYHLEVLSKVESYTQRINKVRGK